jgi:hypothetical protein
VDGSDDMFWNDSGEGGNVRRECEEDEDVASEDEDLCSWMQNFRQEDINSGGVADGSTVVG